MVRFLWTHFQRKTQANWFALSRWNRVRERKQFEGKGWGNMSNINKYNINTLPCSLVLSIQTNFLFAARVFIREAPLPPHPDPMGTTDSSTMGTVCALWMTDLSIQANPPPHPSYPPYLSHTHIQTTGLHNRQPKAVISFGCSVPWFIRQTDTVRIFVIKCQITEQECLHWKQRGCFDNTNWWNSGFVLLSWWLAFFNHLPGDELLVHNPRSWWQCSLVFSSTYNWFSWSHYFVCLQYMFVSMSSWIISTHLTYRP